MNLVQIGDNGSKFLYGMARGSLRIARRCFARVGNGNDAYNRDMARAGFDALLDAERLRDRARVVRKVEIARGWR